MRKINKNSPITKFTEFVSKNSGADWNNDFSRPGCSGHNIYIETRLTILTQEQNRICGYSEIPIENERDCHIDHFRKRSMFPEKTFDWDNLIASCNDDDFGAKFKDNKSGISKSDYQYFFNPINEHVQNYFYYNEIGEVEPKYDLNVIEIFNLQDKSLVNRRKTIINQVKNCSTLSPEEIKEVMKYSGFISLIEQLTNNIPTSSSNN